MTRTHHSFAICLGLLFLSAGDVTAFTFLGFPGMDSIENGRIRRWEDYSTLQPFSLSYAIDDGFFASQPSIQQQAREAVITAMDTWSDASMGLSFEQADWGAVPNSDDITHFGYEGPGVDEFVPGETPLPGWGANIDFFTRPSGFEIVSEGRTYTMEETNLGFALVNYTSHQINSVDIYLNEDSPLIDWRVDGSSSGFDVQTVLLHELGHGIGFDHPDLADENNAPNLKPEDFLPGRQAVTSDVMYSQYTGVKRELGPDEKAGLWYLYPVIDQQTGDLTNDAIVDIEDLGIMLSFFERHVPVADIDQSGFVDGTDLAILLASLDDDFDDDGNDDPIPLPAPGSFLVFAVSLPVLSRRRR